MKSSPPILTLCSKRQIDGEDFVNLCGFLTKHELYMSADSCLFFCFHKVLALTPLPLENSNFFLLFWRRSREDAASCFYISSACRSVCRTYFQLLWKLSEVLRLKLNLILSILGFSHLWKCISTIFAQKRQHYKWNDEIV